MALALVFAVTSTFTWAQCPSESHNNLGRLTNAGHPCYEGNICCNADWAEVRENDNCYSSCHGHGYSNFCVVAWYCGSYHGCGNYVCA